ncbi:MAG TPA: hypothetical protein DIW34_05695 [Oribacterium sp.]|nr:hypothetical protein [Oribacterium sp.]
MQKPRTMKAALWIGCLSLFLTGCGNQVDALRLEGIDLVEKGKYEEAVATFDEAMTKSKGQVGAEQYDILLYKAEAEYMLGDYDAARKIIATLREVDGDQPAYLEFQTQLDARQYIETATKALNEGDTNTARTSLDQAKEAGLTNDKDYQFDELVYLEKTAQWQEAYAAVQTFLENYPGDADATRELEFLRTRVDEMANN